jgi:hypothetical protein
MTMMRSVWVSMICDSFRVSKWFAIASPRPTPRYVGLVNRRIADGGRLGNYSRTIWEREATGKVRVAGVSRNDMLPASRIRAPR